MRLLLHACCAPCLIMPHRLLRDEGHEITVLWYNPNIHPFDEYMKRRRALEVYAERERIPVIYIDEYWMEDWIRKAVAYMERGLPRRRFCYLQRLTRTAREARERGFEAFSTTLLLSRHQEHELVVEAAEIASRMFGIPFLYRDWRPYEEEGLREAKRLSLYRQKYCGCVFSMDERGMALYHKRLYSF